MEGLGGMFWGAGTARPEAATLNLGVLQANLACRNLAGAAIFAFRGGNAHEGSARRQVCKLSGCSHLIFLLHVSLAESGKSLINAWRVKCREVERYWIADPLRQGCVICEIVSRERVHEHGQPRRLQNGNNLVQIRVQEVNFELRIRVRTNLVISHLANKD